MDQLNPQSIFQRIENLLQISRQSQQYSDEDLILNALQIQKLDYNDKILNHQGKGSKKICSAPIPKGTLYFKCFECSKEMTHVYCQVCFIREKHLNHVVTYHYSNGGCCDCGDTLIMNKDSFCNKHQSKIVQIHNPQKILGDQFVKQYEEFIMTSFGLLYNLIDQIVDYPSNFINFIQQLQRDISETETNLEISQNLNKFLDQRKVFEDMIKVYKMIFRVLKNLTQNNILISFLTSQCLQKPINEEIQKHLPLKHAHYQDKFAQFKLLNNAEKCNCCILELYVKYNQFMSERNKDKEVQDLSEIFYELHVDDTFKQNLCSYIIQNFDHLYRPQQNQQIYTNNGASLKIQINFHNYKFQSFEKEALFNLLSSSSVKRRIVKNQIYQAGLFQYFYQFTGDVILTLLKLYQQSKKVKNYQIFDINAKNLLYIPLQNSSSQTLIQKFNDLIIQQFYNETVNKLFDQIEELLGQDKNSFQESIIDSQSNNFRILQESSLLIYALTRIYPCTQTKVQTFEFSYTYEQQKYANSLFIQLTVLTNYRNLLRIVCGTFQSRNVNSQQSIRNLNRLLINYFLNNVISSFSLTKSEPALKQFLKHQILSDRNFISILAGYLFEFKDTQVAYQNVLELSEHQPDKFKQIMHNLLKRTMLSFVVLKSFGNKEVYCGKIKLFQEISRQSEISLESVDITYFQIYAFIFGSEGISDIFDCYQYTSAVFNKQSHPADLICRIALIDYDYFQTISFCQNYQISEQFQRSLSKLFQTIFFAQAFQSSEELISNLKQISFESRIDLQQIILSSCEINKDNDQLQLKKLLQPALYEPIFARQIPNLKDFINDKLRNKGDYYTELFGNSLEQELSELANPKSTLTWKRLAILKAISNDEKQSLLLYIIALLNQKLNEEDYRELEQVLEENSIFINLLFQVNRHLKVKNNQIIQNPNQVNQLIQNSSSQVILNNLRSIYLICVHVYNEDLSPSKIYNTYTSYAKLLEENSNLLSKESDELNLIRAQAKKKQFQLKFLKMSNLAIKKENIQVQIDQSINCCSLCQLPFSCQENQYKAVLVQKTNSLKYFQHLFELNQFSYFFSHHISACPHSFHLACLINQVKQIEIDDSKYMKCPVCLQPFNFPLMDANNLNDISNKDLKKTLLYYVQTLSDKEKHYYNLKFQKHNELDIPFLVNELITKCLCNLIQQLLQDIILFIKNEYYLILQTFIKLLSLCYNIGLKSQLSDINERNSPEVLKFISLVNALIIQKNDLLQFNLQVKQLFNSIDIDLLYKAFTDCNSKIMQESIYPTVINFNQIKIQLQANYAQTFKQNYKQFLVSYLLFPCQKKKCNSTKLPQYQPQKENFFLKFLCLICKKKMCLYCKELNFGKKLNNLINHNLKKHEGKSMYLNIQTGEIYIMTGPYYIILKQCLFKNLIGEKPLLNYQSSEYYEKFNLNFKAIEEIVDIILGEKYLNKLFMSMSQLLQFKN